MKVNLHGRLKNVAQCMIAMESELQRRMTDNEFEEFAVAHQPGFHRHSLEEIMQHVEATRKGEHTIAEFADFYCMTKGTNEQRTTVG